MLPFFLKEVITGTAAVTAAREAPARIEKAPTSLTAAEADPGGEESAQAGRMVAPPPFSKQRKYKSLNRSFHGS